MLELIHDWIASHPEMWNVIRGSGAILLSLFAVEIKSFVMIPPRRITVWVLEARLFAARTKLDRMERRLSDRTHQLASYTAGISLTFMPLLGLIMMAIGSVWDLAQGRLHGSELYLDQVISDALALMGLFSVTLLASIALRDFRSNRSRKKLNASIERLRSKLTSRGIMVPAEQPEQQV